MAEEDKDSEDGVHRVETIPPPEGEDDAYSAPTKVGPMADAAVKELMQAAERRAAELSARMAEKKSEAASKAAAAAAAPTPVPPPPVPPPAPPASVKPAAAARPAPSPARTESPPATGPVTGRVPAPTVGPIGRSVPATPPMSAKPPSIPRPVAIPRVDSPPAFPPAPPKVPAPPERPSALGSARPPEVTASAAPAAGEGERERPPRLYDDSDESDDAATLLHKSAGPPRQEHTALIPSAVPPAPRVPQIPAMTVADTLPPRPREPIPFDRTMAAPLPDEAPRVMLMPLIVGFLIFAIGLGFYIWAR